MANLLRYLGLLTKAEAKALASEAADNARRDAHDAYRYQAERDGYGEASLRGGAGLPLFSHLRYLADACDAVRLCVEECKAQILSTPWHIVAADKAANTGEEKREIVQAQEFFESEGGLGPPGESFVEFTEKLLEDLLVCGAAAVYRRPTQGGKTYSVEVIDAATIKPLVSKEGWAPQGDEPAYEQNIGGRVVGTYTTSELYYLRMAPRSNSRWGRSPTERALSAIYQYLGWDDLTLSWLRDGDADHTIYTTPPEWTPKQNIAFAEYLESLNQTLSKRQNTPIVITDGVKKYPARPRPESVGEKEQIHCLKRIAKAFQLNASVLGFAGETYKVAQGEQLRLAELSAKLPRLQMLSRFFTTILREDLGLEKVQFVFDVLPSDRMVIATVLNRAGHTYFTQNEGRQMLGLGPAEGRWVDALWTPLPDGTPMILGYPKGMTPMDTGEEEAGEEATAPPAEEETEELGKAARDDLRRWERKALKLHREGKALDFAFTSEVIPGAVSTRVAAGLSKAQTPAEIREAFRQAAAAEPSLTASRLAGDLEQLLHAVREERGRRQGW